MRNYSSKTVKSYLYYIEKYLNFAQKHRLKFKQKAIKTFLLHLQAKNLSSQTINLSLNAVKFLYRDALKSKEKIDIRCAKQPKKLPVVLSRKEIVKIITAVKIIDIVCF